MHEYGKREKDEPRNAVLLERVRHYARLGAQGDLPLAVRKVHMKPCS